MSDALNLLNEIAATVDTAAGSVSRSLGAMSALKSLLKKSETGTDADIKLALAELANEVADTKIANASLKQQISALRSQLEAAQAFDQDMADYALTQTAGGAIVYKRQNPQDANLPPHYLCPKCVADRRKFILQRRQGYLSATCPNCSSKFQVAAYKR